MTITEGPTTCLTFLSIEEDMLMGVLPLPRNKLKRLLHSMHQGVVGVERDAMTNGGSLSGLLAIRAGSLLWRWCPQEKCGEA